LIIYLDSIIFELQTAGGISSYWYELVSRFIQSEHKVFLIKGGSWKRNILGREFNSEIEHLSFEIPIPLFLRRYLSPKCRMSDEALFHSSYYRTPTKSLVTSVVTVHDFVYEYYRSGLPKIIHSFQKRRAIKKARGIICVSKNTKRDLLKLYPELRKKKIVVIYNGISDKFFPIKGLKENKNRSPSKSILYVGSRLKYKNFKLAVETVKQLPEFELVVVGGGDLKKDEKRLLEKALAGRYRFMGYVSSSYLNTLYNLSFCLLYPSGYEGFGIPIGEAMKAGCPVVTAKSSAIPEVCGEAGIMINSISPEAFASAIMSLKNREYRKFIIEKGLKQAEKFSWDKCFQETLKFYSYISAN